MASLAVANYITKLRGLKQRVANPVTQQIAAVANYITKLRGLKPSSWWRVVCRAMGCKLYHKTTWFETCELPRE